MQENNYKLSNKAVLCMTVSFEENELVSKELRKQYLSEA